MLEQLVQDAAFDYALLIKDRYCNPGTSLLSSIAVACEHKFGKVVVIGIEQCFSNDLPILSRHQSITLDLSIKNAHRCATEILNQLPSSECCVVFTSLSLLTMATSTHFVAVLIHKLKPRVNKMVALLHKDVLIDEDMITSVEYLFDSVINLKPVDKDLQQAYHGHAKCRRRRQNGKLETSDEFFALNDDFMLKIVHASTSAAIKCIIESNADSITSNLTFNLTLSDQERKAKNSLQLPYLKKVEEKEALLKQQSRSGAPTVTVGAESSSNSSGGKIYYHYDEADDFDEEDPDDDLDI